MKGFASTTGRVVSHSEMSKDPLDFSLSTSLLFVVQFSFFLLLIMSCANSNCFRGNKRVDYLCMEPSGRTTARLQKDDGSLEDVGQVKFSEDLDRANFRFADVDGKIPREHLFPSSGAVRS